MPKHGILLVSNFLSRNASYSASAELALRLRAENYPIICTSAKQNRILRLADMIATCIHRRREYDLANVSVFSGNAFLWAEVITHLLAWMNKPVVLTLHGGSLPEFSRQHSGRIRRLFSRAAAVTSPSTFLRDHMKGFDTDIQVIPNALTIDTYPFRVRHPAKPRLIWMRAFHEMYNPMLIPPIMANLQADFSEANIQVIGPIKDDSLDRTVKLAESLGVRDRITIIPGVAKNSVPAYLDSADIFLNTTNVDNHPVSVLEAMACGLCVISTNVGGLPYVIKSGENGLLCPANDLLAMAGAIRSILKDPQLARSISKNARQSVEPFDWDIVLPQWQKLFSRVAA